MLWQDAYCMAIGDDALHPVFPLCPKAWPHQDLLTEKVLLDPVPELAPEAVDIRKRGQVCGTHDIDAVISGGSTATVRLDGPVTVRRRAD